mgnify:CR=1 FL=1|jgi:hypothetical protein|tara:strand:- start:3322 stop:4140 length:819 start_codon:yes stop_codon:yes gene_type:complete
MKEVILPNCHPLFKYFPELESEDKTYAEFKDEVAVKLKEIYKKSDKFALQAEIESDEHINWRYPIMTPYFIRDEVSNKTLMHVGARKGELCEGFSHFAKKIICVENQPWMAYAARVVGRPYKCPREGVVDDVFKIDRGFFEKTDVFYTYITFEIDPRILAHINDNVTSEKTLYFAFPQVIYKFEPFCRSIQEFIEKTGSKVDYVPVVFDESVDYQRKYDTDHTYKPRQFPVVAETPFTESVNDREWRDCETHCDQWGVVLLLKITLNKNNSD